MPSDTPTPEERAKATYGCIKAGNLCGEEIIAAEIRAAIEALGLCPRHSGLGDTLSGTCPVCTMESMGAMLDALGGGTVAEIRERISAQASRETEARVREECARDTERLDWIESQRGEWKGWYVRVDEGGFSLDRWNGEPRTLREAIDAIRAGGKK